MKYRVILACLLLGVCNVYAQTDSLCQTAGLQHSRFMSGLPFSEMGHHAIVLSGNISLTSNNVNGDAFQHILFNSYLDDKAKATFYGTLKGENRVYYNQSFNMHYYKQCTNKWLSGYTIQAAQYTQVSAQYNRDAFILATSGNGSFENQTAYLDNTKINVLNNYAFGGSMIFNISHHTLLLGISAEALAAVGAFDLNIKNGSLYTAPYGAYLNANLNGTINTTDTLPSHQGHMNGTGFKLGGFLEWQANKNNILTLSVQNIGRVFYNSQSYRFSSDTTLHFDGYSVSSLFDPSSSGLSFNTDSLGKLFGIHSKRTNFVQDLMPVINLQYVHIFPSIHITSGIQALIQDNIRYNGVVTIFGQYVFKNGWFIGPNGSYYTNNYGAVGLLAGKSWRHIHLYLCSNNIFQYWRYSHLTNESLKARISVTF